MKQTQYRKNPVEIYTTNHHVMFFEKKLQTCFWHDAIPFKIIKSSYCSEQNKIYFTYQLSIPNAKNFGNLIMNSYEIDDEDFKLFVDKVFNPCIGEVVSVYEKDFVGVKGTCNICFINGEPFVILSSVNLLK